jgi:hypothetical protein
MKRGASRPRSQSETWGTLISIVQTATPASLSGNMRKMRHRLAQSFSYAICMELIFEAREAEEGGYVARALGQAIFTEAETWQELRDNVLEVTSLHFEDAPIKPKLIHPLRCLNCRF